MSQKTTLIALAASAVLVVVMSGDKIASRYKGMVEALNPARTHVNQAIEQNETLSTGDITGATTAEDIAFGNSADEIPAARYGVGLYFYPAAGMEKALDGKVLPDSNIDGYPIVAGVLANSPAAEAGITAGTILTSINDQPIAGLSISAIREIISSGGETPVIVGILGDDEPIELTPVVLERKSP